VWEQLAFSCGLFAGKYECEPPPLLTNEKQPSRPERLHYKVLTVPSIAGFGLMAKGQNCANVWAILCQFNVLLKAGMAITHHLI